MNLIKILWKLFENCNCNYLEIVRFLNLYLSLAVVFDNLLCVNWALLDTSSCDVSSEGSIFRRFYPDFDGPYLSLACNILQSCCVNRALSNKLTSGEFGEPYLY